MFHKNSCSQKFCNVHRETPVLESFDKVAGLQTCNFIKTRLQHKCFLVKIAKFFRTPILKYICKRFLLVILYAICTTNDSKSTF